MNKKFPDIALSEKYENVVSRLSPLYDRHDDIRSPFARDYTRILHCRAYRRLKHKTQVFYNISNDHVCTRIEHVNHVESVSYTIANDLGLNTELTRAIAIAHDLGHAPFGHEGESILKKITRLFLGKDEYFWHEKNGLNFVDNIELLQNEKGKYSNLNLTYGVRDGIISHCGEIDENGIKPRKEFIDLTKIKKANEYQPYTWEGCVVKISDKIAYLGRDIEDANRLGWLSKEDFDDLRGIAAKHGIENVINTTSIIHEFITDLCLSSSPEEGLCLSDENYQLMNEIKKYNYEKIYSNERFKYYHRYAQMIILSIFDVLSSLYSGKETITDIEKKMTVYPKLINGFYKWLITYSVSGDENYINKKIYDLSDEKQYIRSIIDYISGMSDKYIISVFEELIRFE
ncbi:MAG: HD domain-containing protein [Firmicutes bacterium]|nr:HD domain-containing protein [Bacillota bacterium]